MSRPLFRVGDIVVCVNNEPPADQPTNPIARRSLVVGEIYEVLGASSDSVRVCTRACCSCHPSSTWSVTGPTEVSFLPWRFEKVGRIGGTR